MEKKQIHDVQILIQKKMYFKEDTHLETKQKDKVFSSVLTFSMMHRQSYSQ